MMLGGGAATPYLTEVQKWDPNSPWTQILGGVGDIALNPLTWAGGYLGGKVAGPVLRGAGKAIGLLKKGSKAAAAASGLPLRP